jgi:hypothetical protein
MIDDGEFLRLAYRFGGEVADVEALLARGRRANPAKTAAEAAGKTPHKAIDPETGEARGSARIG